MFGAGRVAAVHGARRASNRDNRSSTTSTNSSSGSSMFNSMKASAEKAYAAASEAAKQGKAKLDSAMGSSSAEQRADGVTPEKIAQLQGMGFDKDDASTALLQANGDVQGAIALLLGESQPFIPPSSEGRRTQQSGTAQPHGTLQPGMKVRLKGLVREPHLNGLEGTLEALDDEETARQANGVQRWTVRMLDGNKMRLKPENVELQMPAAGTTQPLGTLQPGMKVRLKGLVRDPHLNGMEGTLEALDDEETARQANGVPRWTVRMADGTKMRLKPENVELKKKTTDEMLAAYKRGKASVIDAKRRAEAYFSGKKSQPSAAAQTAPPPERSKPFQSPPAAQTEPPSAQAFQPPPRTAADAAAVRRANAEAAERRLQEARARNRGTMDDWRRWRLENQQNRQGVRQPANEARSDTAATIGKATVTSRSPVDDDEEEDLQRALAASMTATEEPSARQGEGRPELGPTLDVRFKPGPLGIQIDGQTGKVESITDTSDEGQAHKNGVRPGLSIESIDGQPFNIQLLQNKMQGEVPYAVKFTQAQAVPMTREDRDLKLAMAASLMEGGGSAASDTAEGAAAAATDSAAAAATEYEKDARDNTGTLAEDPELFELQLRQAIAEEELQLQIALAASMQEERTALEHRLEELTSAPASPEKPSAVAAAASPAEIAAENTTIGEIDTQLADVRAREALVEVECQEKMQEVEELQAAQAALAGQVSIPKEANPFDEEVKKGIADLIGEVRDESGKDEPARRDLVNEQEVEQVTESAEEKPSELVVEAVPTPSGQDVTVSAEEKPSEHTVEVTTTSGGQESAGSSERETCELDVATAAASSGQEVIGPVEEKLTESVVETIPTPGGQGVTVSAEEKPSEHIVDASATFSGQESSEKKLCELTVDAATTSGGQEVTGSDQENPSEVVEEVLPTTDGQEVSGFVEEKSRELIVEAGATSGGPDATGSAEEEPNEHVAEATATSDGQECISSSDIKPSELVVEAAATSDGQELPASTEEKPSGIVVETIATSGDQELTGLAEAKAGDMVAEEAATLSGQASGDADSKEEVAS